MNTKRIWKGAFLGFTKPMVLRMLMGSLFCWGHCYFIRPAPSVRPARVFFADTRLFSFSGAYPPVGSANTSAEPPPILPPWCSATSCWCQITLLLFCKLVVGSWKQVFVEHFEAQTLHVAVLLQVADGCGWCRGWTVKTDGRGLGGRPEAGICIAF